MTIPANWLFEETTVDEIEEHLAAEGAPDMWLAEWRHLLGRAVPGDELWTYWTVLQDDPASDDGDASDYREGLALVRDGEVVDALSTAMMW